MTVTEPVPSPLANAARDMVGGALQATLVDLIDLSLVAKQTHWNLVGHRFHDVHLHLDELVATARKYTDLVAERAAAIGCAPDGRARTVADRSMVPDFPSGWIDDTDATRRIFEAIDEVIQRIRPRIADTETSDLVTQDVLIEVARELEKARWMWRAQSVDASGRPLS